MYMWEVLLQEQEQERERRFLGVYSGNSEGCEE